MYFHLSEPLPPTNFMIVTTTEHQASLTAFFGWNPPRGTGPEYFIEYYEITITSEFSSHRNSTDVNSTMWDITLNYNEIYAFSIISMNCAGQSGPVPLDNIRFGEY